MTNGRKHEQAAMSTRVSEPFDVRDYLPCDEETNEGRRYVRSLRRRLAALSGLLTVAALAACGGGSEEGEPDLVPVPQIISLNPVTVSFCVRVNDRKDLAVTVRNQGTGGASDSPVRVVFPGNQVSPTKTGGPLVSPDIAVITFPIPFGCFGSDCTFTILVDPDNMIDESSEGNNIAVGTCFG